MTTEFEVISDCEMEDSDEISIDSSTPIIGDKDTYSQNDHTFMYELYRENRQLLDQILEKDKLIAKLEERTIYLLNSNAFWLCCYFGSTVINIFQLIKQ